ncbi:MAG: methyltransferase domain-containing protein [Solirubrobacterales bacterium]|nr:methyltransferase domain-containing protein [Solirubrobacterales bacterium]MCB8970123.1 methyltransferase domain-containing protein [Thermoleophilales bacterium]MCO5326780.1 methyltransferase domain-containing protein [Solirubrobacterales bacterium]
MNAAAPPQPAAVVWHDAECGGYAADLPTWERLAAEHDGPVLDLGAGTGRVALHLAARGHEVVAVDSDPDLLATLRGRAAGRSVDVETLLADVRDLDLGERSFGLVIAPMQLIHLLGGPEGRRRAFDSAATVLGDGGALAMTILREPLPPSGVPAPLPDVREVDGWVHSSLPIAVEVGPETVELVRLRQLVSPDGELSEKRSVTRLDRVDPAALDAELAACGLTCSRAEPIAATDEHVGSLLVVAQPTQGGTDA